ncbi:uncharacterized protein [Zea mays]|uniref:PRC-barrel domain-containing protein n=1 Tax=Zea mays TaxID=4577 RepID=A0A804R7M4_MAIZE|nr:uncharacterized protein LOC100304384 isoform X1 [Zea mays]
MCSCACARLLPPLFSPAPSPNLRPAFPHSPTPARSRAVVALAGAASRDDAPAPLSSFDFLALKRELDEEEEAVVAVDAKEGAGAVNEDDGELGAEWSAGGTRRRRRRQMARRSALLAKQWAVALVEVKPSLLSGEAEKFLFEDIYQVGDVVLVANESVIDNEHKLVGLHSLVGYNVVTSRRRNVGKVRGFTFDISSGAMESLELDSFGLSIVPSSLVSTYCLFVEDVLDIVSDTVVVHEDAVSRVQRLTQGILGTQNIHGPGGEIDEYGRFGGRGRRRRANGQGKSGGRELRSEPKHPDDEWELPMDY